MIILLLLIIILRLLYIYYIRQTLRNMLNDTVQSFNTNNVEYFLDSSTLLSLVRDNDIQLGINRLAISAMDTETNNEMIQMALSELSKKYTVSGMGNYGIKKYGLTLSIMMAKDTSDGFIIDNTVIPKKLISPIYQQQVVIHTKTISVFLPVDSIKLMRFRYGDDFLKNNRKWYTLYFDTKLLLF